mmetsp:Transcript_42263/g.97852  ORF Transcript_42263/g.97852 Transcript_42263/m.97852 type:complete len:377 (-) Transcript_42263:317-1447(-)
MPAVLGARQCRHVGARRRGWHLPRWGATSHHHARWRAREWREVLANAHCEVHAIERALVDREALGQPPVDDLRGAAVAELAELVLDVLPQQLRPHIQRRAQRPRLGQQLRVVLGVDVGELFPLEVEALPLVQQLGDLLLGEGHLLFHPHQPLLVAGHVLGPARVVNDAPVVLAKCVGLGARDLHAPQSLLKRVHRPLGDLHGGRHVVVVLLPRLRRAEALLVRRLLPRSLDLDPVERGADLGHARVGLGLARLVDGGWEHVGVGRQVAEVCALGGARRALLQALQLDRCLERPWRELAAEALHRLPTLLVELLLLPRDPLLVVLLDSREARAGPMALERRVRVRDLVGHCPVVARAAAAHCAEHLGRLDAGRVDAG